MRPHWCAPVFFALALSCAGDDSLPRETPASGGSAGNGASGTNNSEGGATAGAGVAGASGSAHSAAAGTGSIGQGGASASAGQGGLGGTAGTLAGGAGGTAGSGAENTGAMGGSNGGAAGVVNPCTAMPALLQWQALDPAPFAGSAAWVVHQGILHVQPHNQQRHFSYDLTTNTWTEYGPPPTSFSSIVSDNGAMYAFTNNSPTNMEHSVFLWDDSTEQWQPVAEVPTPRNIPAVVPLSGTAYFVGDVWFESATVNTVSRYVMQSNQWLEDTSFPIQADCAGATETGEIFAFGTASQLNPTRTVSLDTATMNWTERTPMPASRAYASMLSRKDHFWIVGGSLNASYSEGTFVYSPTADAWCDGPVLPTGLARAILFENNGFIYVLAGHLSSLSENDLFWKAQLGQP